MNRLALLALASLLLSAAACTPKASDDGGPVVARIDGKDVHEGELDAWLREDLFDKATAGKDAASLYEFRNDGLERMISQRLLDDEAKRRGMDVADLHEQVTKDVSVSDDDVQKFWNDNRARLPDTSFEEIAPRIHSYLEQQARAEVWNGFVDDLRKKAGVEVLMKVPRLDVAAVGPSRGPEDAPVTIIEFSDFNCPFCKRVEPTLKTLRLRYPDRIRLVFRQFPLEMHPRARPIAEASVCAAEQGEDVFWKFHDGVFATGKPLSDDEILALAESVGADGTALQACLASGRAAKVVERDLADGEAAGVTGTPAFFINGIRLSGAQPADAFVKLIEQESPSSATAEAPKEAPAS